jgi:hypothetical protein
MLAAATFQDVEMFVSTSDAVSYDGSVIWQVGKWVSVQNLTICLLWESVRAGYVHSPPPSA